jgi:ABC-type antimicrobial peptide transport system permease subunit
VSAPQDGTDPGDRAQRVVPPTAVRLLPLFVVAFGLSMLIDMTTNWPMLLRWAIAGVGGVSAQLIAVRIWASRRR